MTAPRWFSKALTRLSGNPVAQDLLWRTVNTSLNLLGIGPGSHPIWSGEKILVKKLEEEYARSRHALCIFDVGAHHGEFLDQVAIALRTKTIPCSVHAFEPSRQSFEQLQQRHGGHPNTFLNNFALGRAAGELELHADLPGSGLSSFSRRRLDHFELTFGYSEPVKVQTLDAYCNQHSVEAIDLLKLDVEGHELDVMQGGIRMLRERRIRMLTFEFGGCNIDSRTFIQDYWYFIQDNRIGNVFRLTPSGYLAPITVYTELYEQFRPTNFLVVCSTG